MLQRYNFAEIYARQLLLSINYSGKKKRHTQKTQVVADKASKRIICIAFDRGRRGTISSCSKRAGFI
jgi:hypothetical protein